MTIYYLFIILAWIGGSLSGYLIAQYQNNRSNRKTQSKNSIKSKQAYLFAKDVMNMIQDGKFLNMSHDKLFSDFNNIFSKVEVYRRLYESGKLKDMDCEEIAVFGNQMFSTDVTFNSYTLLFKARTYINTYLYHYHGNKSDNKRFWERKKQEGKINDYKIYERSFAYRIYKDIPCYIYKFSILKDNISGILFMNIVDLPIDGFRVTALIAASGHRRI